MISTLNQTAINLFLITCKHEIKKGNKHFVNRTMIKNGKEITSKQALLDIGIMNQKEIWNHIMELVIEDCIKVTIDYDKKRDTNSEIFIFKKIINHKNIYIKLTIRLQGIICISFHESY